MLISPLSLPLILSLSLISSEGVGGRGGDGEEAKRGRAMQILVGQPHRSE